MLLCVVAVVAVMLVRRTGQRETPFIRHGNLGNRWQSAAVPLTGVQFPDDVSLPPEGAGVM